MEVTRHNLRNISRRIIACAVSLAVGVSVVMAVPAKPGILEYRMSDGSVIPVTLHGDETSSYYMSVDGYVLLPDERGDLYYAVLDSDMPVRSDVKAAVGGHLSSDDMDFVESIDKSATLEAVRKADARSRMGARALRSRALSPESMDLITSYPTVGSPNALILLVEFKDVRFRVNNPNESFDNLINQRGYSYKGATGSAFDYFYDNSGGLFTPSFQVYGPVTLDQNESYYGGKEGMNYDKQAWKMVTEGCEKLREMHPDLDFSQFDNDGDGFIDNVFVFYAGYGENEGGPSWTIWPHAANVFTYYGVNKSYDGVKLGNYACTNELRGTSGVTIGGIGTFCHEFSHILGLPDLYPTDYSGAFSPGSFEIMDVGSYNNYSNTPPNMSVYDLMSLGWIKVRNLSGAETVTLNSIDSKEALKISTAKEEEFFLLENRQLTGWDSHIPGHGMLVWHIDYIPSQWDNNTVNNNASHQCVDIVEADGITTEATRSGDPFPGTSRKTSFTSSSVPAMKTWSGVDPEMPITDIRETDGIISFKVKGGGDRIDPVTATEATDVTATTFTANWTGRPEIAMYEVDLCRGQELLPLSTVTVRSATSYTFSGLDPETVYRYTVRAVDGERKSLDSNEITVTTAPPTFDMLFLTALPADNIYADRFTAKWEALPGADSYELSVYSKDINDPTAYVADFTTEGGSMLPEGWTTTATSTDSRNGYFGKERPSLKMAGRTQLCTPVFTDDVNYLRMWIRGNNTVSTDRIEIDGLISSAWQNIHTVTDVPVAEGRTIEIGNDSEIRMPIGVKSLRIRFFTDSGTSLCIDDVEVGAGGSYTPVYVGDYNLRDVGNISSETVTGLRKNTTYYYQVRGVSGDLRSLPSDEISVTTSSTGALTVAGSDEVEIISVPEGVEIINRTGDPRSVECFTPAGVLLYRGRVPARSTLRIPLPISTIVKCGSITFK